MTVTEPGNPWTGVGKQLGAGFAALTAVFAFAGVSSGGVQRIMRNEPELALLWFVLIGVGIVMGLASAVVPSTTLKWRDAITIVGSVAAVSVGLLLGAHLLLTVQEDPKPWERVAGSLVLVVAALIVFGLVAWRVRPRIQLASTESSAEGRPSLRATVIVVGTIFFLAGFFGAFRLAVTSARIKERPELTASLTSADGVTYMEGTVKAAGLRSNDHLHLRVLGWSHHRKDWKHVYENRTGPDPDGKVSHTFKVRVPTADVSELHAVSSISEGSTTDVNHCKATTRTIACAIVFLPAPAGRPAVAVKWSTTAGGITASVTARMSRLRNDQALRLLVWRVGEASYLYRSSSVAGADGVVEVTADVPAGAAGGRLCVQAVAEATEEVAAPTSPPSTCPLSSGPSTVHEVVVPSGAAATTTTTTKP